MTDIPARQRQLYGTTADWAANNLVLGQGEIGVEYVSSSDIRTKIGDGTNTFSALPYSSYSTAINPATQAALAAKLSLAGGTMLGSLILAADPVAPLEAATKQYVDAINSVLSTSLSGKLSAAGGTLTGSLTLAGAPTSALHAATKAYVDAGDAAKLSKSGDTMSGALVLAADPANALEAATKQYVDGGAYQTVVGGSATYAGKVVKLNASGQIDTSVLPSGASYLGSVDMTVAYALSTVTTGSYYTVSTSGTIHSTWASHLNLSPTTCGAGQFLYQNANGKWDLVGDTTLSSSLSGKLDKSGGTMTGALVLAADPTSALHAATKQYVDTFLPKAGGTMSGTLVLAADPTSALHAATKQYADSGDSAVTSGYTAADSALSAILTTSINGKLSLSGGTMTGTLVLAADPTSPLHAATKQYVDAGLALAPLRSNNLSDLANAATARSNLGLGSLAALSSVGTPQITDGAVTGPKIAMGSDARGDILFRGASVYSRLPAGSAGQVLQTNGAGADPSWVTPSSGGGWTRSTAVTLSSQTTVDFTGIPSSARIIKIMFNGLKASSTQSLRIQIGTSSGVDTTANYAGLSHYIGSSTISPVAFSGGFDFDGNSADAPSSSRSGVLELTNISGNLWMASGMFGFAPSLATVWLNGSKSLGAALDRIRLALNASGTFTAGTVNVMYQ